MKWNTHNGPFWYSILQILYHRVPVGHLSGWYILLPSKFIAVRGERNQGLVETVWV